MQPSAMTMLRRAKDADEPTTVWISVVSVVSRDSTSPVRVVSKKFGLKRQHMAEDAGAHVGGDPLADPGDEVEAGRGRNAHDAGDRDQGEEILPDPVRILDRETMIDDTAHGDGKGKGRGRGDDERDQSGDDHPAIGPDEGPKRPQRREIFRFLPPLGLAFDVVDGLLGSLCHGLL